MSQPVNELRKKYFREPEGAHFFCPGCGCGQVLNAFLQSVDDLGLDLEKMITVAGVGCTARIPVYIKTDTLHGVHGRTLPWATGIKLHKPESKVVVFAGDGDAASIGGGHFIQAARRNLDVLMIVVNNFNFAMTGGQVAPMTPKEAVTMTTPYGSGEPPFDLCKVAEASGATYVSRTITARPMEMVRFIKKGLQHKGFGVIEILSQCPTHFGRYAKGTGNPAFLMKWIEENTISAKKASEAGEEEREDKFVTGEFVNIEKPVFAGSSVYEKENCR